MTKRLSSSQNCSPSPWVRDFERSYKISGSCTLNHSKTVSLKNTMTSSLGIFSIHSYFPAFKIFVSGFKYPLNKNKAQMALGFVLNSLKADESSMIFLMDSPVIRFSISERNLSFSFMFVLIVSCMRLLEEVLTQ